METITMEVSAEECKEILSQRDVKEQVKEQVITIARQKKLLETYESKIDFLNEKNINKI
tara:strand:+ start:107 stop:283 length:177 start_codon:yes stop_codon:yes gene_type:complete